MIQDVDILIVEDEALVAQAMREQIEKMGYDNIDIAISYTKAMQYIKSKTPDLILLDIALRGKHTGIDIAYKKEVFNIIPIIYITALTDTKTLKELIATNPKSYLSKPIKYEELQVAIDLALGYKRGIIDIGYSFGYDLKNRNLFIDKKLIRVSPNEKLLLEKLIESQGVSVPSGILVSTIWGNEVKSDSSLRTLVRSLREKLKDEVEDEIKDKIKDEMIKTIPSFGYRLN